MSGRDVRDQLARMLAVELPRKIALVREQLGLDASRMSDVAVLMSGEKPQSSVTNESGSFVEIITPTRVRSRGRVDLDPAGRPIMWNTYAARVYGWALGHTWPLAVEGRDNLAQMIELSLVEYPTCTLDAAEDTGLLVHERTLVITPGEPVPLASRGGGSPRVWGPTVIAFEIDAIEATDLASTRPPLGTADTTTITGAAYGPGEEFPGEDTTP